MLFGVVACVVFVCCLCVLCLCFDLLLLCVVRVVTLCRVTTVTCVLSTCWPERPERLSIADLCVDLVFFYRC